MYYSYEFTKEVIKLKLINKNRDLRDAKPMMETKSIKMETSDCDTACTSDCAQSCGCESDCAASCGCEGSNE